MKRRRWFELHSWLGVITGLMLFLICWSGTMAVLSYEIDWLLDARLRVEPQPERASWGELLASVKSVYPEATRISLHAPPYVRAAAHADIEISGERQRRVYLDPYSAQVRGGTTLFNVQRFFRNLHMCLFDVSNQYGGYWFVGAFGFSLLASSLAPLIFYRRWWRGGFTLKTGRGARIFWSDAHKLSGLWALLFALLIALTSIWYLLEWTDLDLGYPETPRIASAALPAVSGPGLDALVTQAQSAWPQLSIRTLDLPEDSYWGPVLCVEGQTSSWLVRDRSNRLLLDVSTGEVLYQQSAAAMGWPARWIDTADPLHFGNFSGLGVKLIWFAFGLMLCGLCLTGVYLHAQRLHRSHGGATRARIKGANTVNACWMLSLLVIGALGASNVAGYFEAERGGMAYAAMPSAVGSFIAAWCAVTVLVMLRCRRWMKTPASNTRETRSAI